MTKDDAQTLVETRLQKNSDEFGAPKCAILVEETIEKSWGWVFFYQSEAFVKSGNFTDMLGGNAPLIVNKHTSEILETGTAQDISFYIKEYEVNLSNGT